MWSRVLGNYYGTEKSSTLITFINMMGSISPQIAAVPGYQGLLIAPPLSCYSASHLEGSHLPFLQELGMSAYFQSSLLTDSQNPADLPQWCFALTCEAQFVNDKRLLRNKIKQAVFIFKGMLSPWKGKTVFKYTCFSWYPRRTVLRPLHGYHNDMD